MRAECDEHCDKTASIRNPSSYIVGTPTKCGGQLCDYITVMDYTYNCTNVSECTECVSDQNALIHEERQRVCDGSEQCQETTVNPIYGNGTKTISCP